MSHGVDSPECGGGQRSGFLGAGEVKWLHHRKNTDRKEVHFMRLFISIRLSDEYGEIPLVACMHDLKKQGVEGNYVPARNLHMTLAFIGE